jgi:hypothetical protein
MAAGGEFLCQCGPDISSANDSDFHGMSYRECGGATPRSRSVESLPRECVHNSLSSKQDIVDIDVKPVVRAAFAGSCRMRMRERNGAGN